MLTPLLCPEWIRRRCCTLLPKAELALLEEQIKRVLLFLLPLPFPFALQTLPSFGSRGFVIRAEPGKPLPKRGESEENIVIHIKHPFPSFGAVVLACGWKMVGRSRHYSPTGPPSFPRMFFFPISASPTPIYVLFQFPDSFLYSRFHRKRKVQASSPLALLSEAETLAGGCTPRSYVSWHIYFIHNYICKLYIIIYKSEILSNSYHKWVWHEMILISNEINTDLLIFCREIL